MADIRLGPWPLGIDNLSDDTNLPEGSLRSAVNVLVDVDGTIDSAAGARVTHEESGMHSLWATEAGGGYCAVGDQLCRVSGGVPTPFAQLAGSDPLSYCEVNDELVVGSRLQLSRLVGDELVALALETPACVARPHSSGGLNAGRYCVAVSFRRDGGEESGLSRIVVVEVPEGGGIEIDLPAGDATSVSVYRSEVNGAALYRAAQGPAGLTGYLVGAGQVGAMPSTQFLDRLPGGHIMHAWMGRLLVARGRSLLFSSALRYGLHNQTTDFVQLASRLRMVLPVNDGVYIADSKRCYFLNGTDPAQWVLRPLDASPPPIGASALIDGSLVPELPAVPVACWLSEKGFVLGLPEGQLVLAQEKRLRLPMPGQGWLVVKDRRLYAGG